MAGLAPRLPVKTNSAGGLYESTLVNNSNTSTPVQIVYPTRPDLIVSEIISPDIVDAGGKITVEIVIKNQGTSDAKGSWNDLIYLSSDDKIDGGDILLGSFENITALTPGSSYRLKTNSVTVPKYLRGNAFVIVKTDTGNTISEIPREDNNTLYKGIAINDIKPADLVTGNVIVPEQAFAGSQVDVRYRVTNLGITETITDKWTDSIWLAPGKNLQSLAASGSAIKLTDIGHTGSLKVGESYEATVRVTLPTGIDGQYFLTPWSDTYNVVLEDIFDINKNPDDPNEVDNNNYKAAQINILNRPALLLLPDIAVSNVTSTSQKVTGSTDILNVSWTATNVGVISTGGGWRDTIYLADAPTLSAATSYWVVGSVSNQKNLDASESYTNRFSQQVAPTMVGKYVIVNSTFVDATPANNISSGATDINTILPADLVVSSVTTNPTSFSNETVNVSWTVTNQGANVWDGTKYWYDEVWFSADPTFIPGRAQIVGSFLHDNTQSLTGGGSYTNSTTFTLPAGIDGKYYFYVSTDYGYRTDRNSPGISRGTLTPPHPYGEYPQFISQVFENPANNLKATNLQVTYREPDLQVTQVKDPGSLTAGDKLSLNWQVSNLGGRVTRQSDWQDAVFLSKDKSLDVSDLMLAVSEHSGSLNVGGSYDLTSAIKLPINLMVGDYYLLFGTDLQKIPQYRRDSGLLVGKNSGGPEYTTVPEFQDEGNNIRAQAVRIVEPILPDLKVTNVIVPERGIAGQGFEIGYTVKNAGIEATKVIIPPDPRNPLVLPTLWNDTVYLSKDRFLDTTIDRYVGSVARTSNLAANDTYAVTQQFDLPKDLTGAYYLFIVTDGGNTVYEGARELNNAIESVQPILIDLPPAADLRVEDIIVPTGGKSGEAAQIKFTVANRSANAAKGTWSDAVYLSSDANWDIKDRYLGRVTHSGDLVQDATYTSTLTANLPALTPGQYRIIVRTDAQNQVYEGDNEVNNLTTAATPLNLSATELPLNQILTTTLATGQERLYHVVLPKGETLKVSISGDFTAQNEVFIRYGQAPSSAEYDATYSGITNGSPSAIIPGTLAGDYYILVKGQSTAKIKAELLPFSVTDVVTDRGGDGRYVTAQILGAKFQLGAIVKLIRPGIEEVLPVNVETIDSTKITAIFDLTNVTHGLYDIKVINPDGNEAILPYRYQVERAIAPDVTVGLTGKRVLGLEEFATYGISVKSISNLDAPYVQFKYGLPALGTNSKLGIPYTPSNTNLRGNPSNSLTDMPWAELTSDLNTNGEILSSGYIYDFPTGGYIGQNLNLQVYPEILTKFPGINDPLTYVLQYIRAYPAEYIAFVSHITVSATALTRAEFVAQQQQEALRLRSGILADTTATAALKLLAVDADSWVQSYLGALESVGLLRAVDATPPIRTRTLVASMLSTLATGVLLGNAGQKLVSTGDLVGFFANVRKWYGEDTKLAIDPGEVVNLPAPDAQQLDLRATSPTHTQGIGIYVPFMYMQVDAARGSAAANSFGNFFQAAGKVGTEATITGPEDFTSTDTPQTYTIQLQQQISTKASEIRILTQLDPDLDSRTFELGDLYLGDLQVHVPKGRFAFDGDFDFVKTKGYVLHVSAGIDGATNTATWLVQAIDPNTGELVEGAFSGLLGSKGNGRVSYQIQPKQNLATGTEITTQARVFFNNAAPVDTQTITNTIDSVAPTSTVTATPIVVGSSDYLVKWTATDDVRGAGVKGTSIYVSDNGGDFTVWQSQTTASEGVFKGVAGHSYDFLSIALDNAGNIENQQIKLRDLSSRLNSNTGDITVTGGGTPPVVVELPTNSLFTQAQQLIPAKVGNNPSGFQAVIKPFVASTLVKDLPLSNGGVGALAVLPVADGKVLVSGGANRGDLYLVDKLGIKQLITSLTTPIFDLAQDKNGTIWASTGGNQLLQLDPTTGQILGKYGTDLTQALAINPTTGKIYISSGDGIEIFDPATQSFKHFSNQRVDSLAFNSDGSLWATSWAERGNILKFSVTGIPEIVVRTDKQLDSLAFGKLGSKLNNLLFVSSNNGELLAVDLKTKGIVQIASGGLRGEHLATTEDGKIYLAQGSHLDVISPLFPPQILGVNPPPGSSLVLPQSEIRITFDEAMNAGKSSSSSTLFANSVVNINNYSLVGDRNGAVTIQSITYDASAQVAIVKFNTLVPDNYQLKVSDRVQSVDGLNLAAAYQESFTVFGDFASVVDFNFSDVRADRLHHTISYDVSIQNKTDRDVTLPLLLMLDPQLGVTGKPLDARQQDGNYYIDLSQSLPGGKLKAGQKISSRTLTIDNPDRLQTDFTASIYAIPTGGKSPLINSTPVTAAKVGDVYRYQLLATAANTSTNLGYLLTSSPQGMTIDPTTGLISWLPTAKNAADTQITVRVYDSQGVYGEQSYHLNLSGGNHSPLIENLPTVLTGAEGQKLELKVKASDLDSSQTLRYWADRLPGGATFNPESHTFAWIPTDGSAGTYNDVVFYVSDGIETVKQTVSFVIAATNQAPVLERPVDRIVREGETVKFQLPAVDPDSATLTYSSKSLPDGATLNAKTGVFEWTPDYTQAGDYSLSFTVSDGTSQSSVLSSIKVLNVNAAPIFDNFSGWEVQQGKNLRFNAQSIDPDAPFGSKLTYTASNLPTGATFDPATAEFNWTPSNQTVGTYNITFTVTDDGNGTGEAKTTTTIVSLNVLPVDRLPVIKPITNQTSQRGDVIDIPVVVTDENGDTLVLTGTGTTGYTLPDFVTFTDNGNGTGVFHVTPNLNTNAGDYTIYLTATENRIVPLGAENSTTANFLLTVNAPNDRPQFSYQGDIVAIPGVELAIPIFVVDKNQDALTYSISGLPPGAVITPTSTYGKAILTWTPTATELGNYPVTITVTDSGNPLPLSPTSPPLSNTQIFNLVVRASNAAPVLGIIGSKSIAEESKLTFQLSGADLDGDKLTYTATNLPLGAKLDPNTGLFTWTPTAGQAGDYSVKFTTSDGNKSNSETVKLTVAHTNHNPILTPLPLQRGNEQKTLIFNLIGNDIDGDSLLFTIDSVKRDGVSTSIPQGVYLDQNTGKFVWTPNYNQAGEYTFKFATIDAYGGRDSKEIKVLIDNVDRAPTLNISDRGTTIGREVKFILDAKDLDLNTTLVYAAKDLPLGATLNPSTGEFKWTPNAGQLGNYIINFSVSDGELVTEKTATIKVLTRIEPPKLILDLTPSFPVLPGQKVVVSALADSIADITDIKVKVDGVLVDTFKYNSSHNGGNFTFISSEIGRHELEIIATDADGRTSKLDRVIKVKDINDTLAPFVELAPGLNGAKLTSNTQIAGQIVDTNLDEWRLEIAELGTDNYQTINSGYTPTVTTYDLPVTSYQNGFYQLKLTGKDISGRTSVSTAIVEVNTPTKAGYQNTVTDLNLTLGGIPVEISRHYDANTGKWTFNTNSNIQLNLSPLPLTPSPLEVNTRLYLTTPTGERVGFTFRPTKHQIKGAVYYTPAWVADAGVSYTLQSVDAKLTSVGGKFYELTSGVAYNPASGSLKGVEYTLTGASGVYELDAQGNLVGRTAPNGTKLIYTDSGIISSTGEVIGFVKNAAGQITQITTPDSAQLVYTYNAQGDLVSVTNSGSGRVENYGYSQQHQLRVLTRNVGSLGEVIASNGTSTPITQNIGGLSGWNNGKSIDSPTQPGTQFYTFDLRDSELKSTPNKNLLISVEGDGISQLNGINPVYTNGNYRIFTADKVGINLLELTTANTSTPLSAGLPPTTYNLRVIGDVNRDGKVNGVDAGLVTNAFGTNIGDAKYDRTFDLDRNGSIDASDLQLLSGNYGFTAAPAAANSTRPDKLGTVSQTPSTITLTEGTNLLTQTTQRIKLYGTGQHLIEFDLDASFNLTDKTSASIDQFAVYLVDPITRQTILDRGERGTSLLTITDTKTEIANGLVKYQGSHVQIDVGSLNTYGDAELVFQLINADRDTGSTVNIRNLTDTLHADISAGIFRPETRQLAALGGTIDLTGYAATNNAKLLVSNVSLDSTTGKYVADLQVQNTGTTNLARNLAILFPNLPAGVNLVNKSGTDSSGVPYLNFQKAVEIGGLRPSQKSALIRITFDDPALTQFNITPTFLTGSQDVAPTFKSLGTITLKPGERFTTDLIATDPNNAPIAIGLQNLVALNADGLSAQIDSLGQLTIAPSPTQIGTHTFTLTARQGNLLVQQDVTVNVIPDPITDTRVSGTIKGSDGTVLAGVVVALGNAISTTNALGEFTLTVPTGETANVLKVTEQLTAIGISHSGFSTDLNTLLGHNLYTGSNNQLANAIQVPLIDFNRATSIDSTHQFVVTNSQLPQVTLTIGSGSLVDELGQPTTALVSLSEVPLSALPAAFPENFYPDTVISVTFSGAAKLNTAAAITAPNRARYSPDTKLNLWKFDANTGEFIKVGKGVVSLDGNTIKTTTGGVSSDGIYTYLPEPAAAVADANNPFSQPTTQLFDAASVPINSAADLKTGVVTDSQALVGYQSMGMNQALTLHYNSQWANPIRFLNGQIDKFTPSENYNRLVEKWVIRNGNSSVVVPGSNRDMSQGIHGGEHFYALPTAPGEIVTTPFTKVNEFTTLDSGIYEVLHTLALARYESQSNYLYGSGQTLSEEYLNINRSSNNYGNASFGAGWSLGGVQELLLTRNDGQTGLLYRNKSQDPTNKIDNTASVAIVDGDGKTMFYRPAQTIFNSAGQAKTLTYTSAVGDYSKFVKNLIDSVDANGQTIEKGTYTRTLKDGTVYLFDKWGQLKTITDLNSNQTSFLYSNTGYLEKITDPAGQKTEFTVDSNGLVTQMKSPGNLITKFHYQNGDLWKIENPDGSIRAWSYDPNNPHQISTFTDEEGKTGYDYYDDYGRADRAIQRDGNLVDIKIGSDAIIPVVYESWQNTSTISVGGVPLVAAVAFTQDQIIAEVNNFANQVQQTALNKNGQVTKATDAIGGIVETKYNLDRLPSKTIDKYGNVTTYKYNKQGDVIDVIYDDVNVGDKTTRIFSDNTTSLPLDPTNKSYGGVGNAIQVVAYKNGTQSVAAIGTSKSRIQLVTRDGTSGAIGNTAPIPLDLLIPGQRFTSLQQLVVDGNSLYVGYDVHDPNPTITSLEVDAISPGIAAPFYGGIPASSFTAISSDPSLAFYLKDNRFSSADVRAQSRVAKFDLTEQGPTFNSRASLGAKRFSVFRSTFSIGDLAVGAVRPGERDVVAINEIGKFPRWGLALEGSDGKLTGNPFSTVTDATDGYAGNDTASTYSMSSIMIPGIDYFHLGYKIAVLDDGIVAATIPNQKQLALVKWVDAERTWTVNSILTTGDATLPQEITALDTITIAGKKQLVYVAGNHLYLQAATGANTTAKDLGIVGTSQAMAVGDINKDGYLDIAVADYNQNLHVFILDGLGNVTSSQTSKINAKPRDIKIFDWDGDGYNDILIADGGSGLDIKLNQLKPVAPTTPILPPLHTKFEYTYVPDANGIDTNRIWTKIQTDIIDQSTGSIRQTTSTFDNTTGNLTNIKVVGTDNSTTAETNTHYNSDGTIDWIKDANNNWTQYNYFGSSLTGESKQVKTIQRGYGTSDVTTESYEYYDTGYVKEFKDGNGKTTYYKYDDMNRQIKVTKTVVDPVTSIGTDVITSTDYYKTGWVKSVADANNQSPIESENHKTSFEYDGVGRITKQTAADGGKTEYTYNDIRELEYVTLKLSDDTVFKKTKYDYDNAQRIIEIKDVLSSGDLATTTGYTYSPYGTNPKPEIITTVKGSGQTRVTTDQYDRYQRLVKSTNPIGTVTNNEYFDDGQIKSVTIESAGGLPAHQTKFEYDGLGRQNKVVDALGSTTLMKYDLVGNLTKMTDANTFALYGDSLNHYTVENKYDALNRKTETITPVTTYNVVNNTPTTADLTTEYKYDKNSNLTKITDAQGRITTNTYDELNRRTSSTIANITPIDALDIPITTSRIKYDGVGNVLESTDANGHTTKYEYDPLNRQNKVTDALGKVVSQKVYDAAGRVTSSTNMYGVVTATSYNNAAHTMTMTNPLGISTQKTDAFGNVVQTKDAAGRTNNYTYDELNRQISSVDYRGGVVVNTYDGFNNLIRQTDASQNTTYYEYDKLNRLTSTSDRFDGSINQISRIGYDDVGNKIWEKLTVNNGEERLNTYQYDALSRQYAMTTAVGSTAAATSWTSYDKVGNIVGTKDPLNRITTSVYDKLNRQTSVTQAVGTLDETTSSYKYDNVGNRLSEINGRGYETQYVYDALNRQIEIRDPYQIFNPITNPINNPTNNTLTKTEYFDTPLSVDAVLTELPSGIVAAKVVKTTDAKNHATYVLYDQYGRQIATYDAIKHQTSATKYDSVDRVTDSTDTFDRNTSYTYQDLPNQKVTRDSLGVTKTEKFDAAGNLTEVNLSGINIPPNRTTYHTYDSRNRQIKVTDANGGETNYSYYKDNKTASIKDAVGNKTEYTYDVAGRLVTEQLSGVPANGVAPIDLGSREYKYDLVNNRIKTTDRNGRTTNYAYDNLNRIKTEAWADGSKTFTYSYDKNGNRLTADDGKIKYVNSYDKTDLLETVDRFDDGNPNPKVTFNYTYDEIGSLTQTQEVVNSIIKATTAYEYDDRYLNTKITQKGAGLADKAVKFTYNTKGENTKIERYLDGLLKVTTDNAYDIYGRLTGIAQVKGMTPTNPTGTPISDDSYVLDGLNRLQTQTKGGQVKEIGYDKTDQVQTVTGGAGEAYTYDLNGNRTGGGYTTGVDNRLTSDGVYNYLYDAEGNRTSRRNIVSGAVDEYAWDYRNRLTGIVSKTSSTGTITQTVGYTYDVDDQRVSKTVTTGTVSTTEKYYLDGNQIAFVTDGGGNQMFHYLYGLNVDQVLAQDSSTGMVWSLADRLGSIDTLTDGDGVVVDKRTFDSFGRVLSETNPSVQFRYGYTGRELDLESGLNYYRARYYDSNVGRFISADPMGFGAGDTNLYRYVGNNSTNATDPSGELAWFAIPLIVAVGGALLGAYQNYDYQQSRIADGKQHNVDYTDVASSAAWGAVGATAGLAITTLAPESIPFFAATGLVSGTSSYLQAKDAESRGEYNTASHYYKMGIFDVAGSIFASAHPPSSPPSLQSAMALASSTSVGGALVGSRVSDIFQHYFAADRNDPQRENLGEYKDPNTYEIENHEVDLRTSPIEIPGENVNTKGMYQTGTGINGDGVDPYWQVKFLWEKDKWKYMARWHTVRQGAPEGSGNQWIATRKMDQINAVKGNIQTGTDPHGNPVYKKVVIEQVVPKKEEIYLHSPDEWIDIKAYNAAKNKNIQDRTDNDNILLDRGHSRDDIKRR